MTASRESFLDRHYFLLRRLHSLSGVVPIGVFLLPHLTTNSSIVWGSWLGKDQHGHAGVEAFQHEVNFIHSLPALLFIEIFVLWLPIAFHAGFGMYIATTGKSNVRHYDYQDNWRYSMQRWTGYLGVIFIFMHLSSLRWGFEWWGIMPGFDVHAASSTTARHFQEGSLGIVVPIFYLISVLALVFHFANGLWTAAITWGLTISTQAQQRWGYVCAAIGVGLSMAGVAAVIGFSVLDIEEAERVEQRMRGETTTISVDPAGISSADARQTPELPGWQTG